MPRSFDVSTESSASVEQIYWAFSREDYWLARIALGDTATTTLDSLNVDPDGRVTVRVTQHLGRQLLPGPVAKFARGELKLVHEETWKPADDGQVLGQVNVTASPRVGGSRAEASLKPNGNGTHLRFAGKVEVKIPLVGGKLEKSLGAGLDESIPALQRFTTSWIADHS
ncbi:DUF2505 domain-containing protein [Mycobacterium sp. Aquia_213]|uniref:DUF2505 domain-containing protein n=1 Tax=Mycobacterium sp. Aquia_213 TaxID=2991728 RepID=UPI00226E39A2|nr:DUF2505 domain-containing protein [Mycobacterium sp. Aquia_213]WAC93429.1 DUF2505 domain-containing protein [Mycobacterium sp. Aquia_213]